MFCRKCGKEIKTGRFCSCCGTEQTKETVIKEKSEDRVGEIPNSTKVENFPDAVTKPMKFSNKSTIVIVAAVLLFVFAVGFLFLKPSKSEEFIELLKSGDYEQAVTYYQSELAGNEKEVQKVYEVVSAEINGVVDSYYANSISYDDAKNSLSIYSNFYNTETDKALQSIEMLKVSQDAFVKAEEKYAAEEYEEAYDLYLQVIETDSNFAIAKGKRNDCYNLIVEQIFAISEMKMSEGDYLSAIAHIRNELTFLNSNDQDRANSKIQEYLDVYIASNKVQIEQYLSEKKYSECFDLLNYAINSITESAELEQILQSVTEEYEKYISELVYIEINERDFTGAADILNTARGELPNSEIFTQLTSELAEYTPVSIYSLEPYAVGIKLPQPSGYKDTMSNVYNKTFRIVSSSGYYNVYDISQKYSVLTGVIAVPYESVGAVGSGYVRVYGDNVLLWEDNNITSTTKPYEMSVNISGVTDLKIEMGGAKGYQGVHVLFADVTLQK